MKQNFYSFCAAALLTFMPIFSLSGKAQAVQPYVSQVWSPDQGDGTYINPVINSDYSDPDVIAVGEDYYMTASSFNCIPGLPVLHSRDLVNWEIIGHAIQKIAPDSVFSKPSYGNGVWAPSIRYHNGEFYIYWGDPDYGVFMVSSKDPEGPWTAPHCVIPGKGMIDTTPLWDDDGRCYLVNAWANSRTHFASVLTVRELNAGGTEPVGNPVIVFDGNGTENRTCEGPKFYKRQGWYWILCPAGGVSSGFQLAMRSRSPFGPYEAKKVLAQGRTKVNGPHQGAWIHTAFGEDWFIHFQDKGAYGRVVFLEPVHWKDNWPVIGKIPSNGYCGEPVLRYRKPRTAGGTVKENPQESDEFNSPRLGLQWQWQADYDQTFGMPTSLGVFRLFTYGTDGTIWDIPNLLLQKTPADRFTATAKVEFTAKEDRQYGGIIMMGLDYSALVLARAGDRFQLQQITCRQADQGGKEMVRSLFSLPPTSKDHNGYQEGLHEAGYLRMAVRDGQVRFFWSTDGTNFKEVGNSFRMRQGKWVGAKIGFVAEKPAGKSNRGWLDIDWFRITR